jgi:hypothetical protein
MDVMGTDENKNQKGQKNLEKQKEKFIDLMTPDKEDPKLRMQEPYSLVIKVQGRTTRVLLDTGAGATYLLCSPTCRLFDGLIDKSEIIQVRGVSGGTASQGAVTVSLEFIGGSIPGTFLAKMPILRTSPPEITGFLNKERFLVLGGRNLMNYFGIILGNGKISYSENVLYTETNQLNQDISTTVLNAVLEQTETDLHVEHVTTHETDAHVGHVTEALVEQETTLKVLNTVNKERQDSIVSNTCKEQNKAVLNTGSEQSGTNMEVQHRSYNLVGREHQSSVLDTSLVEQGKQSVLGTLSGDDFPRDARMIAHKNEVFLVEAIRHTSYRQDEKNSASACNESVGKAHARLQPAEIHLNTADPVYASCDVCLFVDDEVREATAGLRKPLYSKKDDTSTEWKPITGSPTFRIREKELGIGEIRDTPQQRFAYEIAWDTSEATGEAARTYDFGAKLFDKLNPDQQNLFRSEISKYKANNWWKEGEAMENGHEIICFPLVQGDHKSTKIRPVLDCRAYNRHLGRATYRGPDCGTILREIRLIFTTFGDLSREELQLITLDMKTAFYRIRLFNSQVAIKCEAKTYVSDRVTFGTKYGPAALEATVRSLLYKALITQRDAPNIHIRYYLDDITVVGYCLDSFVEQLSSIGESFGFEFPVAKRNHVTFTRDSETKLWRAKPFKEFLHLGVWFTHEDGSVILRCKTRPSPVVETITKREGFKVAGLGIDPLWAHPRRQSAADLIRRMVGSERDWDTVCPTDNKLFASLAKVATEAEQCAHEIFVETLNYVKIDCDASLGGFGYVIWINTKQFVARSRLWQPNQTVWDINRKELFTVLEALKEFHAIHWVFPRLPLYINTDSKSACAWLNGAAVEGKARTKLIIANWIDFKDELIQQWTPNIAQTIFSHIAGPTNTADWLSRLPYELGGRQLALKTAVDDVLLAESLEPHPDANLDWKGIKLPILEFWDSWRRVARGGGEVAQANPSDDGITEDDETRFKARFNSLVRIAQEQSPGLKIQIEFLETKNRGGVDLATLIELTKFRFVKNGILYQLRFSHGDITRSPTVIAVLDGETTWGNYILRELTKQMHEQSGHKATEKYISWKIGKRFAANNVLKLVRQVVQECRECTTKAWKWARRSPYLVQRYLDSSCQHFCDVVSTDLYTIPEGKRVLGMNYILVVVDHFTRFCFLGALKDKQAKTIWAQLDKWFQITGRPNVIRSDNEPVFKYLARKSQLADQWDCVPQYSPFTNGICERVMGSVGNHVTKHGATWYLKLPRLQWYLNHKRLDSNYSPHELVFGLQHENIRLEDLEESDESLHDRIMKSHLELRLEVMRERENRPPTRAPPKGNQTLRIGDLVTKTYLKELRVCVITKALDAVKFEVLDLKTRKKTLEHLRNLKNFTDVSEEDDTGGTDVESQEDSPDRLEQMDADR